MIGGGGFLVILVADDVPAVLRIGTRLDSVVRVAHVRERHGPAGAPWRLAAAARRGSAWLDLEVARRRLVAADPRRAHNSVLFRQPITTLDDVLARGLRIEALGEILDGFAAAGGARDDDDDAVLGAANLAFGPPILRPPSFRDFYAFEQHVATMWGRRGSEIPEAWHRLPIFYFSNTSEIRGPGDPVWAPRGSTELDFELEVGAIVDTPAYNLPEERAAEAIGGYFVLNDWSARDLQRDESAVRLGPAKGKDFATSIGPWIVTPDELADAGRPVRRRRTSTMTATVAGADGRTVEVSRGSWSTRPLLVRADARARFGGRPRAAGRDPGQRHRRHRLPARGQGRRRSAAGSSPATW